MGRPGSYLGFLASALVPLELALILVALVLNGSVVAINVGVMHPKRWRRAVRLHHVAGPRGCMRLFDRLRLPAEYVDEGALPMHAHVQRPLRLLAHVGRLEQPLSCRRWDRRIRPRSIGLRSRASNGAPVLHGPGRSPTVGSSASILARVSASISSHMRESLLASPLRDHHLPIPSTAIIMPSPPNGQRGAASARSRASTDGASSGSWRP